VSMTKPAPTRVLVVDDDHVSKPFSSRRERGLEGSRREYGGGGLGLAIAKGLVEAHEGSIEVANRALGCGFTVRLNRSP